MAEINIYQEPLVNPYTSARLAPPVAIPGHLPEATRGDTRPAAPGIRPGRISTRGPAVSPTLLPKNGRQRRNCSGWSMNSSPGTVDYFLCSPAVAQR